MPEPVTVILIGAAAYSWLKGREQHAAGAVIPGAPGTQVVPGTLAPNGQPVPIPSPVGGPISIAASGTGGSAPLATNTGNANGLPLTAALVAATPVPGDLAFILDNETALMLREYAALHPQDFQVFLDRYADRMQMREDGYFKMLTDPPPAGFQMTPQMVASMGNAAYKVAQGLNGVAAGRSVDLFGLSATAAGAIPGVNKDFVSALQGLALTYRAITATITLADISAIAVANGVGIMDVTAQMLAAGSQGVVAGQIFGAEAVGAVVAPIAAPIASLSGVLMAVGLVVDIAFTIIGNEPDIQKAIDVALDVASLVCLFIPVVGWIIAIVIQLVKFIIDLFGEDLFGGGLSHAQREALEAARYGENIGPMWPELADAFSPRELQRSIYQWGSGYCGGNHTVAMSVNLILHAGDVLMVGGKMYTVPADTTLGIANQGCYFYAGTPWAGITNDEQAWALAKYASRNGILAEAQVGISEALKPQFDIPTQNIISARMHPVQTFIDHGLSLDQIDTIIAEYRAQPHLNAVAIAFGWAKWQDMLGDVLHDEWMAFQFAITHGSLHDFAVANGYTNMFAFREAAIASYSTALNTVQMAVRWAQAEAASLVTI